jgi:hypothetical protein
VEAVVGVGHFGTLREELGTESMFVFEVEIENVSTILGLELDAMLKLKLKKGGIAEEYLALRIFIHDEILIVYKQNNHAA